MDISDRNSAEEDDSNRRRPSRGRPKGFEEIDLPGKDRGRQSELGIQFQHRRLQTTDNPDTANTMFEAIRDQGVLSDPEREQRNQLYP